MTLELLAAKLEAIMTENPLVHDCKASADDGCATCLDLNDLWQIAIRNQDVDRRALTSK